MASPRLPVETAERGDLEANVREKDEDAYEANKEAFSGCNDAKVAVMSEITPLLDSAIQTVQNPPRMTIFSVSYPRSTSKERVNRHMESDFCTTFHQFLMWMWSGSKYSGFLCTLFSSLTYCVMELLLQIFSVQSIPLFERVSSRCVIVFFMSFTWLRRTGQPLLGPSHVRKLLIARAVAGSLSLLCFTYSIQRLPPAYAILLNFMTPITASFSARVILQEKLAITDIGGLCCSFLGTLLIFLPVFSLHGVLPGDLTDTGISVTNVNIYAVLIGIASSLLGGISYCLIRAGAKASDHPVVTVFAFAVVATPITALFSLVFEELVVPAVGSFLLMTVLGILAFFAEVLIARGLQIEKTCKISNIQYIEIVMLQILGMILLGEPTSIPRLSGCALITTSFLVTIYLGPDKMPE